MNKLCKRCNSWKLESEFAPSHFKQSGGKCRGCNSAYMNEVRKKYKNKQMEYDRAYYKRNKKVILERKKDRRRGNVKRKALSKENRRAYCNNYYKNKRKVDSYFRIRAAVSANINHHLFNGKGGKSFLKYLDYSIEELKNHLELQFEDWMNWNNYGKFHSKSWKDNDTTTWKWQIDHIIPQSTFNYSSMEDPSFRECWSLSNLRPYSSKQNFLDGVRRVRH